MSLSKLLILVVCCLVLAYSAPLLDCDKLSSYCQPYGTAWWRNRATYCFNCDDKVYHCARDYDDPEVHREGCAAEKNCSAGEEPHLSFKQNGQAVTDPVVYCNPCYDRNYYNRVSRRSSTYSECPNEKRNDCSSGKHKVFCETEDLTDERYCRCDARKGFSPINDFSYVECSYKDYECLDDYKCPNLPNGKAQQMLLNYTCAAVCDEGYDRLSEDSDECLIKTTVATSQKPTTIVPPIPERNKTTDSSRIPAPASTQIPTCSEECDQFSTCHNGTCVCLDDACSDPYEPVCGYDAKSEKYRTFPSSCELNRAYCRQKQFVFHSDGECITAVPGETNNKSSTIKPFIAVALVCVLLILDIFCYCKCFKQKCRDKFCRYPKNIEIIVPEPTPPESVDSTVADVVGRQSNGRHTERQISQLSAPLSEHEDSSTPALRSKAERSSQKTVINKTKIIVNGPYFHSKGGHTQITLPDNSSKVKNGNIEMKYNQGDVKDGENVHLLESEEEETEFGEEPKPSSVIEEPYKREVPVVVHKTDDEFQDENNMPNLGSKDEVDDVTDGEGTTTKTTVLDELKTGVESERKQVTKKAENNETLGQSHSKGICRRISVSHESLLSLINAETLCKDDDEYKKLINKVIDGCWNYLLDNMCPVSMLDLFRTKGILDHKTLRDIQDHFKQTDRNREILKKIRETGKQYYHQFKLCLTETKQDSCLAKVEQVQRDVIKKMNQETPLHESNGRCRHSSLYSSLPGDLNNPSCKSEEQEMVPGDIGSRADRWVPDKSTTAVSTDNDVNMLPKVPSDETQAQKQNKRLLEASSLPSLEETIEQLAHMELSDLAAFLLKNDGVSKIWKRFESFEEFAKKCKEIRAKFLDLTAERLLPKQLVGTYKIRESYPYRNIPCGFQASRSSGNDNSCLYQSVSLQLTGSENSQCSLRLLATLHAVEYFSVYRELLHHSVEEFKPYFHSLIDEQTIKDLNALDDDDQSLVDACLKLLIMETACLGTESGVLHVEFLSGALGIKIVQYFQHVTGYGKKRETKPLAKVKGDEESKSSLRLPDLYIFWVNSSNTENGALNHIVPLFPVGNDSEEICKHVS